MYISSTVCTIYVSGWVGGGGGGEQWLMKGSAWGHVPWEISYVGNSEIKFLVLENADHVTKLYWRFSGGYQFTVLAAQAI